MPRRTIAATSFVLVLAWLVLPVHGQPGVNALSDRVFLPIAHKMPEPIATATPEPTETLQPTATTAPEPTATTAPSGVPILSYTDRQSSTSYRRLIGEVLNNTGRNVEFVKIIATFYNASGQVAGTDSGYTTVDILTPGQRSPFTVLYEASQPHASFKLQVTWSPTNDQPVTGVVILSHGWRSSSTSYNRIFGEVRNDSGGPVDFVRIIATVYDAQNRVVGNDGCYTEIDRLEVGGTSPFECVSEKQGGVRYELQVRARRP